MTAFILKIIAIITMTLDHSSFFIYNSTRLTWMRILGRIAFPIFAFQISEGYTHTKNLKKYFFRLIIFALLSQIPYFYFSTMFFNMISYNIIFSLILGLLAITVFDYFEKKSKSTKNNNYLLLGLLSVFLIALLTKKLDLDYGYYGILLMFIFFIFRNKKYLMNIFVTIITFLYYIPFLITSYTYNNFSMFETLIYSFFFSLLPLIFINMYNGKQGKKCKWLFYIYYPLHITLICLLHIIF